MRSMLTAVLVTGLASGLTLPSAAHQDKEKPVPISKQALLGWWEVRSGGMTLRVSFEHRRAVVITYDARDETKFGRGYAADYQVDRKADVVRITFLGEGQLVEGDRLRLTLGAAQGRLAKGAVLTLTRLKGRDAK
jgi:hypothetical protein